MTLNNTTKHAAVAALLGSLVVAAGCGDSDDSSLTSDGGGGSRGGIAGSKNGGGSINLDPTGQAGERGLPGAGGANCGYTKLTATSPEVNVLLVVDKSLSMKDEPVGFAQSKWTALRTALEGAFEQTQDKISFGLDLYPYSGTSGELLDNSCQMPEDAAVVVPIEAGTSATPLILAALDDNPPSGGTPTASALARALAYFTSGDGQSLTGDRYVLLATDGGPNCGTAEDISCAASACTVNLDGLCPGNINCCDETLDPDGPSKCLDDAASVRAVADLAAARIRTFVIGIPGTEAYAETLDELAAESGVENPDAPPGYLAVSAEGGVDGLASVLSRITTGLITTCRLQLEEQPPDIDDVYVVVDGELLEKDGPDGWAESDPVTSPPTIEILGDTCARLEADGAEYINVSYGCPNYEPR